MRGIRGIFFVRDAKRHAGAKVFYGTDAQPRFLRVAQAQAAVQVGQPNTAAVAVRNAFAQRFQLFPCHAVAVIDHTQVHLITNAAGAHLHVTALVAAQGVQQAVFYHGLQHQAEYLDVHHIVVHFIINNKAFPKAVVLHFHIFFKVVQLFPQADALLRVGQRIL